jgi:uncharacterized NAD(P)/FAD-binding protein YdhS
MDTALTIGIIGGGPRGLSLLARLVVNNREEVDRIPMKIYIFEQSGLFGGGRTYNPNQPDNQMLNTVVRNVGVLDNDCEGGLPDMPTWCKEKLARDFPDYRTFFGVPVDEITHDDVLSRKAVGSYLSEMYRELVRTAIDIEVIEMPEHVIDIDFDDSQFSIKTPVTTILVDKCVLCTGHSSNIIDPTSEATTFAAEHGLGFYPCLYPTDQSVMKIPDGESLGIVGMGLTALDAIFAGSVLRGGKFEVDSNGKFARDSDGDLIYVPSGRELKMTCISRNAIFITARGLHQKGNREYEGKFFTREAIAKMREKAVRLTGSKKLNFSMSREDWDDELNLFLPMWRDIQSEYYTVLFNEMGKVDVATEIVSRMKSLPSPSPLAVDKIVLQWVTREKLLNLETILTPILHWEYADAQEFNRLHMNLIKTDLARAKLGNVHGPHKAAMDVFRDLRNTLRESVSFGGLTPKAHEYFVHVFDPFNARVACGPPVTSVEMVYALMKQGIVEMCAGPNASILPSHDTNTFVVSGENTGYRREVKNVVRAMIPGFNLNLDSSVLMQNLRLKGAVREYVNYSDTDRSDCFHSGGIEVTEDYRVIAEDGEIVPNLFAIGIPTEGAWWFTLILPRPYNSNVIRSAEHLRSVILERGPFDVRATIFRQSDLQRPSNIEAMANIDEYIRQSERLSIARESVYEHIRLTDLSEVY